MVWGWFVVCVYVCVCAILVHAGACWGVQPKSKTTPFVVSALVKASACIRASSGKRCALNNEPASDPVTYASVGCCLYWELEAYYPCYVCMSSLSLHTTNRLGCGWIGSICLLMTLGLALSGTNEMYRCTHHFSILLGKDVVKLQRLFFRELWHRCFATELLYGGLLLLPVDQVDSRRTQTCLGRFAPDVYKRLAPAYDRRVSVPCSTSVCTQKATVRAPMPGSLNP